jgi:hypothetical protein
MISLVVSIRNRFARSSTQQHHDQNDDQDEDDSSDADVHAHGVPGSVRDYSIGASGALRVRELRVRHS